MHVSTGHEKKKEKSCAPNIELRNSAKKKEKIPKTRERNTCARGSPKKKKPYTPNKVLLQKKANIFAKLRGT